MSVLGQILSSNVRAEIFRLLFGLDRHELYLREIERRSGFAIGTVRQEVTKLVRLGLIRRRRDGNRVYFCAVTANPLFADICNIVLKSTGLSDVLRSGLQEADVEFAFVFGSVASGTQKPESDVDLFVIGEIRLRALTKLLRTPCDILGREINAHVMTAVEFGKRRRQKEHFVSSVLESPKLMIVGEEDDLTELG